MIQSAWGDSKAEDILLELSKQIARIIDDTTFNIKRNGDNHPYRLKSEFKKLKYYDIVGRHDPSSELYVKPSWYEERPSICVFPFYKVQGRRPYWSVFEYGAQDELRVCSKRVDRT